VIYGNDIGNDIASSLLLWLHLSETENVMLLHIVIHLYNSEQQCYLVLGTEVASHIVPSQ
jgi:hypothetical protein